MSDHPTTVALVGGGSWATALAKILTEKPTRLSWWLRDVALADHLRTHGHNARYLSDVRFAAGQVRPSTHLPDVLRGAEVVIIAVPAAFVMPVLATVGADDLAGKLVVSAVKGMVPDENLLVTDLLTRDYGVDRRQLCVIAGPCHAEEVALERQSYLTIAGGALDPATRFARLMSCRYVTATPTTDLEGVEYAAVLKNIVAIACGICHGLGYGDNFQAILVPNALGEMMHFLDAIYPKHRDVSESAYVGDLLVTAYSQFSRNRTLGNMIGRGYSVRSAQVEMNMVAEGYYAARSVHVLAGQHQLEMPIAGAVYEVLYGGTSPRVVMQKLQQQLV